MAVKIVTDSSADLPAELAQELGITVVPLYVRFGEEVYRDRVDISEDDVTPQYPTFSHFARAFKNYFKYRGKNL